MMILSPTSEFSRRSRVNTWPLKQANLEWASGYITPVFCYFWTPRPPAERR